MKNQYTLLTVLLILGGFLAEFMCYLFATNSAASHDGTGFLWFGWAVIAFFGGFAGIGLGGYLSYLVVSGRVKLDD